MHELEAELCKISSKYVILLKESQQPELGGRGRRVCLLSIYLNFQPHPLAPPPSLDGSAVSSDRQELVSRMMKEVLEGDQSDTQLNKARSG